MGFPDSSVGKESACNAGDSSSIPVSGRSTGEGIGYPLQYSWAFLVAQVVENLPAVRETWVQFPGWEDPLEKGKATHSSILTWSHRELDMMEQLSFSLSAHAQGSTSLSHPFFITDQKIESLLLVVICQHSSGHDFGLHPFVQLKQSNLT